MKTQHVWDLLCRFTIIAGVAFLTLSLCEELFFLLEMKSVTLFGNTVVFGSHGDFIWTFLFAAVDVLVLLAVIPAAVYLAWAGIARRGAS